jgi:hypothetical protein
MNRLCYGDPYTGSNAMVRGFRIALVTCFAFFVLASNCSADPATNRVALVIGNGEYLHSKSLPNPTNDATDIAATLEQLGFSVTTALNVSYGEFRNALRSFNAQVQQADIRLIYYAGHGIEIAGENWLIPIDAKLKADIDVPNEAISLKTLMQSVSRAHELGIIILDACRNNPLAAEMTRSKLARSIDRGFARVEPATNVLVAYAAKDGTTAIDGSGRNSPYTGALLRHLQTPHLELGLLFRKVRDDVMATTNKRQQPFVYGSLSGKGIYLNGAETSTGRPAQIASRSVDEIIWLAISRSTDAHLFESFLAKFPNSAHEAQARARLEELRSANECDRLTAVSSNDGARSVSMIDVVKTDPLSAEVACEAASRQFPATPRFALQGGRMAEAVQNYVHARALYQRGVDAGNAAAMISLGTLCESGRGGPQDYDKARGLYKQADSLGDPEAALRLGSLYENGRGVPKDYAQARHWFEKSANLGDRTAMERLAMLFERGLGGPRSKADARKWHLKAQTTSW